jgi:hypothetical protein
VCCRNRVVADSDPACDDEFNVPRPVPKRSSRIDQNCLGVRGEHKLRGVLYRTVGEGCPADAATAQSDSTAS